LMRLLNKPPKVALHPEGVDRNRVCPVRINSGRQSPSTRRAWIEIRKGE
jgi:hypothetical protein